MSWLFGIKTQPPAPPPDETRLNTGQNDRQRSSAAQSSPDGSKFNYSFDSTALERAATAAKELEKSPNAKQMLELSRQQEITKQRKADENIKQVEFEIEKMKTQGALLAEEERRKTLTKETEHANARAQYQDQLARKRQQDELNMKAQMHQENLRKQEESIAKQEALRKATIEHELKMRHKYDLERIETEVRAKAKSARENRDVNLEMMKANEEERRKTVIEQIRTRGFVVGEGFRDFITDPTKVVTAVGALTALAVGWYTARRGTGVIARYVEARLGKPSLVRETSRITPLELFEHPIKLGKRLFTRVEDPLKGVVLSPALESGLRDIAIATRNTKANNGLFSNILFHGPPGTGKTMFAKGLARHSGLDYAIMTGGDFIPMGKDGVSEIHKVFDWAESSRKGLVLFVDEADAFLRKRSVEKITKDARAMLNAFLYRTGTQSKKFMLILASNQPEQFDWAINDRLHELIEFGLPGEAERERILLQYFKEYIIDSVLSGSRSQRLKVSTEFDWIEKMKSLAKKTEGLSARELAYMVNSWKSRASASDDGILTEQIIDRNLESTLQQHATKMKWLKLESKPSSE